MAAQQVVTAALVTATVENGRVVYLYRGDVVPDGVTKESLDNLKSLGFVAAADEATDEGSDGEGGESTTTRRRSSTK